MGRMAPIIVWFRQDLRLSDNPALIHAVNSKRPIVCVYVLDDVTPKEWRWGGASRWWLHKSLEALDAELKRKGGSLFLRRGLAESILPKLIEDTAAEMVVWNRCYEPFAIARDTKLKANLTANGIEVQSFNASLLFEPWELKTRTGGSYRVFTPFWRAARALAPPPVPYPAPPKIDFYEHSIASGDLSDWQLLPSKPDWAGGLRDHWTPGEAGARERLSEFLKHIGKYSGGRDHPDRDDTSRLSPHLHWGEISPGQVWHAVNNHAAEHGSGDKFLSEIGWREFSYHLLFHNPNLPDQPLRADFAGFPWRASGKQFDAWTKGRTGIPIVDAGMRQLWQTGWMHNRVRMIVASFLIKHLLIDWRRGEKWFWDTLVDADLASNSASWQWVAGCGADAAPFFRIFNPVLQGEKFDSEGDYVRRFVPELSEMPAQHIHKPWAAPTEILKAANVEIDENYPHPIVDLAQGRERALAAFQSLRGA
jgi:deoxyribodipyrimidine photo-lyase